MNQQPAGARLQKCAAVRDKKRQCCDGAQRATRCAMSTPNLRLDLSLSAREAIPQKRGGPQLGRLLFMLFAVTSPAPS